ncbi:hypothetical protein O181_026779 [Austropuccinia psidii MF-1]|uniref:Uncharacterized protein n=1 Tax=Austropuccinia psidii MF-1 TaxID=1389203 RepID=A0A9Q3CKL6_9BASI|nr:hypothetical protein [Austropuccinia psidii MF-1]
MRKHKTVSNSAIKFDPYLPSLHKAKLLDYLYQNKPHIVIPNKVKVSELHEMVNDMQKLQELCLFSMKIFECLLGFLKKGRKSTSSNSHSSSKRKHSKSSTSPVSKKKNSSLSPRHSKSTAQSQGQSESASTT